MKEKQGTLRITPVGNVLRVQIAGEIDHHSAKPLREELDRHIYAYRPHELVIELSEVAFMDSSGLGLIMGRFALIKKYGGTLSLLDPSPAVMKMMTLAGMDRMVTILKTKVKGI